MVGPVKDQATLAQRLRWEADTIGGYTPRDGRRRQLLADAAQRIEDLEDALESALRLTVGLDS